MISIALIVLSIAGGFVMGGLIVGAGYYLYDRRLEKNIIKNIPTDRRELSDPGRPIVIDEKEVQEDDRKRFEKFREYEKLRRVETTDSRVVTTEPYYEPSFGEPKRINISNQPVKLNENTVSTAKPVKRTVKLD